MKTKYEVYNIDTQQVENVVEITPEYAEQANKDFRYVDSPRRYVPYKEPAPDDCRCGAEYKYECVCN